MGPVTATVVTAFERATVTAFAGATAFTFAGATAITFEGVADQITATVATAFAGGSGSGGGCCGCKEERWWASVFNSKQLFFERTHSLLFIDCFIKQYNGNNTTRW